MLLWMKCDRALHTTCVIAKTVPKNLKGKSKSSQEWLTRQLNDPYVKKAHEMNYRARSAFKLIEMDDKAKFLRPGMTVLECGAAPGAWTQVLVQRINSDGRDKGKPRGTVIAVDLLPINPLEGAILLPGCDFTSPETLQKISHILSSSGATRNNPNLPQESLNPDAANQLRLIDLVLSDMAPNSSGVKDTDHPRIIRLARTALKFAIDHAKPESSFLTKLWDGSETKPFETELTSFYRKVTRLKPPCSRNDSAEIFIYAKGKRV